MSKSKKGKEVTRERAAKMLERAVSGSRRLGLDDVADRYAEMGLDEYVAEKKLVLTNPSPTSKNNEQKRRITSVATKAELDQENADQYRVISDIWQELSDVDETSTKQELVDAIETVCAIINDFDSEEFPFQDDQEDDDEAEAA